MLRTYLSIVADVDSVVAEDVNLRRRPQSDLAEVRERLADLRGQLCMLGCVLKALPWPIRYLLWAFVARTSHQLRAALHEIHCSSTAVRHAALLHPVPDRRDHWLARATSAH